MTTGGGYSIVKCEEVPDPTGDYPGEMRMFTEPIAAEQVAFTYRRMPQHTGGKGSYGHRHKTQEEIYVVVDGSGRVKLDDDVVELRPLDAVRVSPGVARGFEAGPEGLEVLIFGPHVEGDSEMVDDFWASGSAGHAG